MRSKINKLLILEKLSKLVDYIKELDPILAADAGHFLVKENYRDLRALERDFQLIVDGMIEINSHFIKQLNLSIPDDYTNTFISLGQNKILPLDFSIKLARVVGLRNKIVHKYDIIDQAKFIDDLKNNGKQFKEYIKFIKQYLNENNQEHKIQ